MTLKLFYAVVLATTAHGNLGIYYDHNVEAFAGKTVCELRLPSIVRHAKTDKGFAAAVKTGQDDEISFQGVCSETPPSQWVEHLHSLDPKDNTPT